MAEHETFPCFNFFPADWLTGSPATMTAEQRGVFIDLLAYAWQQTPPCTLPDDDAQLAALAKLPLSRWRRIGGPVRARFQATGDGRLVNRKQKAVYDDMVAHREKRSRAGKKGNEARWGSQGKSQSDRNASRNATAKPVAKRSPPTPPPKEGEANASPLTPAAPSWSDEACRIWVERFGGTANGGRIGKALKPLVVKYGKDEVLAVWRKYLDEKDAEFATPQDFAAKFGEWRKKQAGPQQFDYSNATTQFKGFTA